MGEEIQRMRGKKRRMGVAGRSLQGKKYRLTLVSAF
jgi:hypothetical protein